MTFFSPIEQGVEVDIFAYFNDGNKTQQLVFRGGEEMQDISSADAVACVAKGSDVYRGVRSMDIVAFVTKGNQNGCALSI